MYALKIHIYFSVVYIAANISWTEILLVHVNVLVLWEYVEWLKILISFTLHKYAN